MIPVKYRRLESSHNPLYKKLLAVTKGIGTNGWLFIEGEDLVAEALKAHKLVMTIATDPRFLPTGAKQPLILTPALYKRLATFKSPAKLMGVAKLTLTEKPGARCLYLDRVQDPGNVGTLIRTALALGYSSVFTSPDAASFYNPKTVQASKGAIFALPVGRQDISFLQAKGLNLYLTTLDGQDEKTLSGLRKPFALVLGNEGQGIPPEHLSLGQKITIGIANIDSLNVASAGAIFMYRFRDD